MRGKRDFPLKTFFNHRLRQNEKLLLLFFYLQSKGLLHLQDPEERQRRLHRSRYKVVHLPLRGRRTY